MVLKVYQSNKVHSESSASILTFSLFSSSPYRITIFYWFWFIFLLLLFKYVKENTCKLEILIFTPPHNKTCTHTKGGAHYVLSEPCFRLNNISWTSFHSSMISFLLLHSTFIIMEVSQFPQLDLTDGQWVVSSLLIKNSAAMNSLIYMSFCSSVSVPLG